MTIPERRRADRTISAPIIKPGMLSPDTYFKFDERTDNENVEKDMHYRIGQINTYILHCFHMLCSLLERKCGQIF